MPKSDDDRTLDVLEDWCGLRPPLFTKELINLWEDTRWKSGIIPPAYVRTNTFQSGLEIKY